MILRGQPDWVIFLIIGLFSGFSFVVLYHLSRRLSK